MNVIKKLVIILMMLSGLIMIFSKNTNTDGKIYTGIPNANDDYYQPFKFDIKKLRFPLKSQAVPYGDIWIRDVAPVATSRLVKFKYSPDYLSNHQSHKIDTEFKKWLDSKQFNYTNSNIVLDGGNFIYNGQDTVIMTTKVLTENPKYTKTELIDELKSVLQVSKIILINPEPGDVLGHADGQVHFIQPNVLFIGDFEGNTAVKKQIKVAMPQVKIVDLISNYQESGQYDDQIPSAKGLYINMMETKYAIYVPQYGLKQDKDALKLVSQYTDKQIHSINVSNLSTLGGSVNCLTWYCPKELLPK